MKLSLNWLKDYCHFKNKPEELAELLSLSSFEVEKIHYPAQGLQGVMVGEIRKIEKHPGADRLYLAQVNLGKKNIQVIFGDKAEVKEGEKVPVAVAPMFLPSGLEIKERKIRGKESEGMLCLESELFPGAPEVLIRFDRFVKPGVSLAKALFLNDVVLDLNITPNRADCFSVLGLAREVSALTGKKLFLPSFKVKEDKEKIDLKVEVKEKDLCPKYGARVIKGVKVKESPQWLKSRLILSGIRPINNLVDVTNYLLMETGQPLHVFDADKVDKIIVRKAKENEKLLTLDGKEYLLDSSILVIADSQKPIALAGIMGGKETAVSEKTENIILESALFKPSFIRKASQKLGLRTESSLRFEKGRDRKMAEQALDRAAEMIRELSAGRVIKGKIIVSNQEPRDSRVKVSLNYLQAILGLNVDSKKTKEILTALGFKVKEKKKEFEIIIPSFRNDVRMPADIAEEIGRIYGYNNLEPAFLKGELKPVQEDPSLYYENILKEILISLGFDEVLNYPFYNIHLAERLSGYPLHNHFQLANPINPEQQYLRTSLIPLLAGATSRNLRSFEKVKIFEIGRVFLKGKAIFPKEEKKLAVMISEKGKDKISLYREIKGTAEYIFQKFGLEKIDWKEEKGSFNGYIQNRLIGSLSFFPTKEAGFFKLKDFLVIFSLNFDLFFPLIKEKKKYQSLSSYPGVKRDLSVFIDPHISWFKIKELVLKINPLIKEVELFDLYYREEGKKSLSFHLLYQSSERTLESAEIDKIQEIVIDQLEKKLKAKVRK